MAPGFASTTTPTHPRSRAICKDETEQLPAKTPPLKRIVNGQASQAQDRQRIPRELLAPGRGQVLDLQMPRGHRGVAHDPAVFHCHVGDADMMPELVLAGVLLEEAIQVEVPGAKA